MSLFARETELLTFSQGPTRWRYALGDRDITRDALTWTVVRGLKRGRIVQSAEEQRAPLEIRAPYTLGVLELWRPYPPTEKVAVLLQRLRHSDNALLYGWAGVVGGIEEDTREAKLTCLTHMAAMNAAGLNRVVGVNCTLALYGVGLGMCNADPETHRADVTVSFSSGTTLKGAEFAANGDGWFRGGFIRWTVEGRVHHRFIVEQLGDTATLMSPATLPAGTVVAAYPGCERTLTACDTKFNNAVNHGGIHTLPKESPFGANPVF